MGTLICLPSNLECSLYSVLLWENMSFLRLSVPHCLSVPPSTHFHPTFSLLHSLSCSKWPLPPHPLALLYQDHQQLLCWGTQWLLGSDLDVHMTQSRDLAEMQIRTQRVWVRPVSLHFFRLSVVC